MIKIEEYIRERISQNYAYRNRLKKKLLVVKEEYKDTFHLIELDTFIGAKLRYYIMTDTNIDKYSFYYTFIFDQLREIPTEFWTDYAKEIIGEIKSYGQKDWSLCVMKNKVRMSLR